MTTNSETQTVPEIQIVLVRPLYPTNIGATARTMANMGTRRLILIDSQAPVNLRARQSAAKAQDELRQRVEYANWDEYLSKEPQHVRIAFTARAGQLRPSEPYNQTLDQIFQKKTYKMDERIAPISLVFGPEDAGLTTSDIDHVHYCCMLPSFGNNTSFNLSQAALIAQLIYRQECLKHFDTALSPPERTSLTEEAAPFPDEALREWLELLGIGLDYNKANALNIMKRLILTNVPTAKELRVLGSVIQQTIRKLRGCSKK